VSGGEQGKLEFWGRRRQRESEMLRRKKKTQTADRRIYTRRTGVNPTAKKIWVTWTFPGAVFPAAFIIRKNGEVLKSPNGCVVSRDEDMSK
jgi:hypothetical protein